VASLFAGQGTAVSASDFIFETEFTLLDVGATGALIRSGGLRPTIVAYVEGSGPESTVLEWDRDDDAGIAFEDARRWLRALDPTAYALVAVISRDAINTRFRSASAPPSEGSLLSVAMFTAEGQSRGILYPIRLGSDGLSLGMPTATDVETTDWCPLGDIWANPYCEGDIVRLKPRERAMDPASPLWKAIIELTKMRIQSDQFRSQDYMAFLDDLRNGVFRVAGRPVPDGLIVTLRPRTTYNPIGHLTIEASKLLLVDPGESAPARATGA
jgi:hypothetical protein